MEAFWRYLGNDTSFDVHVPNSETVFIIPQTQGIILKSAIFEQHKRYTPQKKAENNRHSDLKQNQSLLY